MTTLTAEQQQLAVAIQNAVMEQVSAMLANAETPAETPAKAKAKAETPAGNRLQAYYDACNGWNEKTTIAVIDGFLRKHGLYTYSVLFTTAGKQASGKPAKFEEKLATFQSARAMFTGKQATKLDRNKLPKKWRKAGKTPLQWLVVRYVHIVGRAKLESMTPKQRAISFANALISHDLLAIVYPSPTNAKKVSKAHGKGNSKKWAKRNKENTSTMIETGLSESVDFDNVASIVAETETENTFENVAKAQADTQTVADKEMEKQALRYSNARTLHPVIFPIWLQAMNTMVKYRHNGNVKEVNKAIRQAYAEKVINTITHSYPEMMGKDENGKRYFLVDASMYKDSKYQNMQTEIGNSSPHAWLPETPNKATHMERIAHVCMTYFDNLDSKELPLLWVLPAIK